jgi:nickel-type superoxide dismutase maturation protease
MAAKIAEINFREFFLWMTFRRKPFRIQGNSMLPFLSPGDLVLADMKAYRGKSPRIGDIVVARHPHREDLKIIKRVVVFNSDGSVKLKGDNPDESTDFGSIRLDEISGQVTCKFP